MIPQFTIAPIFYSRLVLGSAEELLDTWKLRRGSNYHTDSDPWQAHTPTSFECQNLQRRLRGTALHGHARRGGPGSSANNSEAASWALEHILNGFVARSIAERMLGLDEDELNWLVMFDVTDFLIQLCDGQPDLVAEKDGAVLMHGLRWLSDTENEGSQFIGPAKHFVIWYFRESLDQPNQFSLTNAVGNVFVHLVRRIYEHEYGAGNTSVSS